MLEKVTNSSERVLLELIEELSQCHRNVEVLDVALSRFEAEFRGYDVIGLLLSDPTVSQWQVLPLQNSKNPNKDAVALGDLPKDEPIDYVLGKVGRQATDFIKNSSQLADFVLPNGDRSHYLQKGELVSEIGEVVGQELDTVLCARWNRPRGGVGWLIMGFKDEKVFSEERVHLFELMSLVTTRMAMYPEMVHEAARTERIGASLRRSVVHDLKTPLAVVQGYAQTLLDHNLIEDPNMQKELLRGIVEQAERMIDDLQDLLVPLDDAWLPVAEEFDLSRLVEQSVIAERHTDRASGHTIRLDGCDEPCLIFADRRKIRRVIENLASNAVKYSPGIAKTVTVSLDYDHETVTISVEDSGIGMTTEQLQEALHGNARVADKRLGIEGSGFGLESCQRVLKAHGGELQARSEPSKGSVFTAVLPRRYSPDK